MKHQYNYGRNKCPLENKYLTSNISFTKILFKRTKTKKNIG